MRREYVGAVTRLFGPVFMVSARTLFRRMLLDERGIWRSTHMRRDSYAPLLSVNSHIALPPESAGPMRDSDMAEFVIPTERLRRVKPVWMTRGADLAALAVTTIPGTQGNQLVGWLESARKAQSAPRWGDQDAKRCETPLAVAQSDTVSAAQQQRNALCPPVRAILPIEEGPLPVLFFEVSFFKKSSGV